MAQAGVLDEMTMSSSPQIGAADGIPDAGSSVFVYTVYGCLKGLQDYHLLSRGQANQARFRSASSSRKSLLNREICLAGPIPSEPFGSADNFAEIITVIRLVVHYIAEALSGPDSPGSGFPFWAFKAAKGVFFNRTNNASPRKLELRLRSVCAARKRDVPDSRFIGGRLLSECLPPRSQRTPRFGERIM
jgi:hypothetical protein